jgi:hypothetical protein
MRSLLQDDSGFTVTELLIVCSMTIVLMAALATIFGLGLNTSKTTSSILGSQSRVVAALDRLDYEGRCANQASLVSGGAGVTYTYPTQCTHATGTVTWCVTGGSLIRYSGSSCSGSGLTLINNVTSATPFSCVVPVGNLPAVQAALTVNAGTTSATAASGTDTITLENATVTTASSVMCS